MTYAPVHQKELYVIDLADPEWECLSPHIPAPNKPAQPRIHTSCIILNAIFYVLREAVVPGGFCLASFRLGIPRMLGRNPQSLVRVSR